MRLPSAFLLLIPALLAAAEEFPPIPPEVWAIKSGPKGAVVVEELLRFRRTAVDHSYRVRIFNELGRKAAELPDLPTNALRIVGRTVYPDGRQVTFSSRKDFTERTVERGGDTSTRLHLVPPGVTSDCVMEVSWCEPGDGMLKGLPKRFYDGLYGQFFLANVAPTKRFILEIEQPYPLAFSLNFGFANPPESSSDRGVHRYLFRDVPAFEQPSYSYLPSLQLPVAEVFYQPERLVGVSRKGDQAYWKEAALGFYKEAYETDISRGGAFKDFAEAMGKELPAEPAAAARELLLRLHSKISNYSRPTHAEKALMEKDFWENHQPKHLTKAVKKGYTDSTGIRLLFYHLLKSIGIQPRIAKVADKQSRFFDWRIMNLFQFDVDLIGVPVKDGKTVWFDPAMRHLPPGVIHPDYEGVPALVIDPGAEWAVSMANIPAASMDVSQRRFQYGITLQEDSDAFEVSALFKGFPEARERWRFADLAEAEQAKALKEHFERGLKQARVTGTEVRHASNLRESLGWTVRGSLEREAGRKRTVDPFPGMPSPLYIPGVLETDRTALIEIPHRLIHEASSRFKLPSGFIFEPQAPVERKNGFGSVRWAASMDAATGEVKVDLRVEVSTLLTNPNGWEPFKAFLGWIEDACSRSVVLTRSQP